MNSPLNNNYALVAAFFVGMMISGGSQHSTPQIEVLKRADGVTIVGTEQDAKHFISCKGQQLEIHNGDVIVPTDRTCEQETNGTNCQLCVSHPSSPLTGTTPSSGSTATSMPPSSTSPSTKGGVAGTTSQSQTQTTPSGQSANASGTSATTGTTAATGRQASTGASATASSGSDLETQIQNALKNEPTLSNNNINVIVSDDAIDLSGTVGSGKEKQTAKRIAQSYAGNRKVKDHLTVSGRGQEQNQSVNPPK